MAGKRGPSAMISRSSSLRLVPSTSFWNRAKNVSSTAAAGTSGAAAALAHGSMMGDTALRTSSSNSASLSLEVEIERALGDARPRRHVVEPRRLEAVLGEHGQRRIQDRLPPRLGVDLAARARVWRALPACAPALLSSAAADLPAAGVFDDLRRPAAPRTDPGAALALLPVDRATSRLARYD